MIVNLGNMNDMVLKTVPIAGFSFGVIAWLVDKVGLKDWMIPNFSSLTPFSMTTLIPFLGSLFVGGFVIVGSLYLGSELGKMVKKFY